jgi:hypothetical protein
MADSARLAQQAYKRINSIVSWGRVQGRVRDPVRWPLPSPEVHCRSQSFLDRIEVESVNYDLAWGVGTQPGSFDDGVTEGYHVPEDDSAPWEVRCSSELGDKEMLVCCGFVEGVTDIHYIAAGVGTGVVLGALVKPNIAPLHFNNQDTHLRMGNDEVGLAIARLSALRVEPLDAVENHPLII